MPRRPKPWFRKPRKLWYVCIDGKQHNLGKDKTKAYEKFHKLMSSPQQVVDPSAVSYVLEEFLEWTQQHRSPKTYTWYRDFLNPFHLKYPTLNVDDLTPKHVTEWLTTCTTWNDTTKNKAISALQRAFNWGKRNLDLKQNPIEGMEKPEAATRTQTISSEDVTLIFDSVTDQEFRDIIEFSFECGCRPQEAKWLEARHVQLDKSRCFYAAAEAKKRIPRAIYLSEKAEAILKRLMEEHPTGPLFLNTRGNQWTADAIKCRFAQIEKRTGKRFFQYMFRHTWITEKLKAGVDSHVVAALAGHRDTKMIDRVYSHVSDDAAFMLKQARKKDASASDGESAYSA